ncbi:MAG: hypothetical protein J7500_16635 [Sphingomonas sp.]|uniref:hypothetical protein n=1 Tax=Sphingomonas sp. TaxID=28214 RepID=UPI001B1B942F|nr:hypothetical protein [Sphingomonas sp.]MBO9624337.1 hypothetical protein [Sphingomonas sp.]
MSNILAFFVVAAAISTSLAASNDQAAERVEIRLLESSPSSWIDRKIEICGVDDIGKFGRRRLTDRSTDEPKGVYIAKDLRPSGKLRAARCFIGIWRRLDGRTARQVAAEGSGVVTHGYNPEYELAVE